jgi:hypothetical protein
MSCYTVTINVVENPKGAFKTPKRKFRTTHRKRRKVDDYIPTQREQHITYNDGSYHICRANGDKEWFNSSGQHHRDDDLPAIETSDMKVWYKNGVRHRDNDLPAMIDSTSKWWYKNGKLHRDGDFPAVKWNNGTQFWYKYGVEHRDEDC